MDSMQSPIRSFNRKRSRTYNVRFQRRTERRLRYVEGKDREPVDHSKYTYLAANFLKTAFENGGFVDGVELREEVSRYIGDQGGYTPPLNRVRQQLPDHLFSLINRMPYYDELERNYRKTQISAALC